ncbi:MAG: hypothetical protein GY822_21285 [Deltaproteobacteria bacterium]|nr:hypothetical protein [Deltaproteobacteria bacterium]
MSARLARFYCSLFVGSLVVLSACQSGPPIQNGEFQDEQVHYKIATPGSTWEDISPGEADAAWINESLNAMLMVNSHCSGVDDAPLTALTRHLAFGMTEREWLSEDLVQLSGREALESVLVAKLDGVPRKFMFLVLKKDGCVYDVVLSAPPEDFQKARLGYDRMRKKFSVLERSDVDS